MHYTCYITTDIKEKMTIYDYEKKLRVEGTSISSPLQGSGHITVEGSERTQELKVRKECCEQLSAGHDRMLYQ